MMLYQGAAMSYFSDIHFVGGGYYPDCRHGGIANRFNDFYSLQYDRKGSIYYNMEQREPIVLEAPVLYLLHPNYYYAYGPSQQTKIWSHSWVAFQGERGRRIFEEGFQPLLPAGYYQPINPLAFSQLFDKMIGCISMENGQPRAALALESLLVFLLDEQHQIRRKDPNFEAIMKLADVIQSDPFRNWQLSTCARELHMSYSHFRNRFVACLATSPYNYILRARMLVVASAIRDKGSVKAAATSCGYNDLSQFSRLFKSQMGISPRQYLQLMQS